MPQKSLVAFWGGAKPAPLATLIAELQAIARDTCGDAFRAYEPAQVHATLIGLESTDEEPPVNRNLLQLRGVRHAMDLPGYLGRVAEDLGRAVPLRFGGFARDARPFESRGRSPWERGVSVQGDRVVLIGWPDAVGDDPCPPRLASLRRSGESFGILHAYHPTATDHDNDLYLRLGLLERTPVQASSVVACESRLRACLADRGAVRFDLAAEHVSVVRYSDETLPPATTRRLSLAEALRDRLRLDRDDG